MDGTGPSGVTLDPATAQIFVFDYEWLGVGRVRMGIFIAGQFVPVHQFLNANIGTDVYMSTPNLPLRYQMITTASSPASSMKAICSSVVSEGGVGNNGILRYASTAGTHVDANVENTVYAIIGIRLKAAYIGESVRVERTGIQIQNGGNVGEWLFCIYH